MPDSPGTAHSSAGLHQSRRDWLKVARQFTGGKVAELKYESRQGRLNSCLSGRKPFQASLTGLAFFHSLFPPLKWRATFMASDGNLLLFAGPAN